MIIDIETALNGAIVFVEHTGDGYGLMKMLSAAGLAKDVFFSNYKMLEDSVVFYNTRMQPMVNN